MPSVLDQLDPAFVPHASGLVVPKAHQRARIVWTKKDFKLIDRAIQFLLERDVALLMKCKREGCPSPVFTLVKNPGGGSILRCGCADRVFQKVF